MDFLPILHDFEEQIAKYLGSHLSSGEILQYLEAIYQHPKEVQQAILAEHPSAVFDVLVALGRVLDLIDFIELSEEYPNETISQENAIHVGVMSFLAGFNLAQVLVEDIAQPILKYNARFLDAGKRPRNCTDALDLVLEKIVADHFKDNNELPDWRQVVKRLEDMAGERHPVIQEVEFDNEDEGRVFWKGHDAATPFGRIQKRLTLIRKKYK